MSCAEALPARRMSAASRVAGSCASASLTDADPVARLGLLFAERAVDIVLAELGQGGSLVVDPGQELQGDQDPDEQLRPAEAGNGRRAARLRARRGTSAGMGGRGARTRAAGLGRGVFRR